MAIVPIFDPDRGFRIWSEHELYTGPEGRGRHVANKDDGVWSWTKGMLRVVEVNATTYVPTLKTWKTMKDNNILDDEDVLLGVTGANASESHKCYIDTTVIPHTLKIDGRLHLYGSTHKSVRVFYGSYYDNASKIVSAVYNASGNYVSDAIPLELVKSEGKDNLAIKAPVSAHCTQKLNDGEVLTAVVYDNDGTPRTMTRLLVQNTAFIPGPENVTRQVTNVHLESSFLDPSNPSVLNVPLGMPISSVPMVGVVSYSDGSRRKVSINGTTMALHGMDNYISTVQGETNQLTLTYHLGADESTNIAHSGTTRHLSKPYRLVTAPAVGVYAIKLFVFPEWSNKLGGYQLRAWLCNMDRGGIWDVTKYIKIPAGEKSFLPTTYNVRQNLVISLQLKEVNASWKEYLHIQTVGITLLSSPTKDGNDWKIHSDDGGLPNYGVDTFILAKQIASEYEFDIAVAETVTDLWLSKVYHRTRPLFDSKVESGYLAPTHYRLLYRDLDITRPVEKFLTKERSLTRPVPGELVVIQWIRKTPTNDLYLGVSAIEIVL